MSQWKTPILAGPLANEGALLSAADRAITQSMEEWLAAQFQALLDCENLTSAADEPCPCCLTQRRTVPHVEDEA